MKKSLKMLSGFLVIMLLFVFAFPANQVNAEANPLAIERLAQLSSDNLLDTLVDNGLILPEGLEQNEYTENAVKTIVSDIERGVVNEDHIPYNYTELAELARRILDVSSSKSSAKASYSLINSTVIGSWSNSYTGYNCYGYSIGVHVFQNPGYHSGQGFSMSLPIASMADLVVDDLNTLGYWGYKTTTKPSPLANYQKVVAIRKGSVDYHFMKGDLSGSDWTHKPGGTNPLRWNYSSPGYTTWTNEYSVNNISNPGNITYDSSIYYIIYWAKNGPGPQPNKMEPAI
ncbi:hypothetical protein [Paenibacillus sp. FSL R7-0333]|uniref:hypothetical protein n=1 Tax=Paenibacillus sp. FSL R7-0333 TaxID=1926587 RepID=UPI00096FDD07|nr:hypothetical protein BK146_30960 [Paenibacillus sp. FSL R7-0333]